MLRTILHLIACLTGSFAISAWVFGDLTAAGITGAISAATICAAELVWHCQQRGRDRIRSQREAVWARRIAETPGAIRGGRNPEWLMTTAPGSFKLPPDPFDPNDWGDARIQPEWPQPVWPFENGAPE